MSSTWIDSFTTGPVNGNKILLRQTQATSPSIVVHSFSDYLHTYTLLIAGREYICLENKLAILWGWYICVCSVEFQALHLISGIPSSSYDNKWEVHDFTQICGFRYFDHHLHGHSRTLTHVLWIHFCRGGESDQPSRVPLLAKTQNGLKTLPISKISSEMANHNAEFCIVGLKQGFIKQNFSLSFKAWWYIGCTKNFYSCLTQMNFFTGHQKCILHNIRLTPIYISFWGTFLSYLHEWTHLTIARGFLLLTSDQNQAYQA